MTPEQRVSSYLADCYQRRLHYHQLQTAGLGSMHGWDQIEQLGRHIEAKHWTRTTEWPGIWSCGWGSEDEQESEYVRSYQRVDLSEDLIEVIVECRYADQIKDRTVYRVRHEEDGWRIEMEFEIGWETPILEYCDNPEVTSIRTAPRSLVLERICPSSQGSMRPSIRLHAVRDNTVTAFDSHLAGPFLANDPAAWPRCDCHQTAMLGGLQLWKRDLSALRDTLQNDLFVDITSLQQDAVVEFPEGTDVLQIFWCPFSHPHEQSAHHLRWVDSTAPHASQEVNPSYRQPPSFEGMVPSTCKLHPEWHPDYPALWEARELKWWQSFLDQMQIEENGASLERASDANDDFPEDCINRIYADQVGAVDGIKWGGYPCWIQDPQVPVCECGRPMKHLLTVASLSAPNKEALPVVVESKHPVKWDSDLCMGDVGYVYHFVCPTCPPGTRHEAVFQCS